MKKKLVIIPAYNEAESIVQTVTSIQQAAPQFDYVIVNDCSTDQTLALCRQHGFNVIDLPINLGIGGAVQTGYLYAWRQHYDLAVQIDGDGQHNPAFLDKMAMEFERDDINMVIGSRFIEHEGFQSSFMRRLGIRYFTWLIALLTKERITDATSGLRMVDRSLIERFAQTYPVDYPEPETVVESLINGYRVKEIPVIMNERQGGVSSISLSKSIYYMIKVSLAILFVKVRGKV